MNENRIRRRLLRREQYRSRSQAVVVVLALVVIGLAYVGTEVLLAALSLAPLLVRPAGMVGAVNAPTLPVVIGAGAAVLFGAIVLVLAVAPARRGRHAIAHDRLAIVVDDRVLAGALGRAARTEASVPADRVRTTVTTRRATVAVTPSSGFPVDTTAVTAAARDLGERLAPSPRLRVDLRVAPTGVVGS